MEVIYDDKEVSRTCVGVVVSYCSPEKMEEETCNYANTVEMEKYRCEACSHHHDQGLHYSPPTIMPRHTLNEDKFWPFWL